MATVGIKGLIHSHLITVTIVISASGYAKRHSSLIFNNNKAE